jgi:hypothetical protein
VAAEPATEPRADAAGASCSGEIVH